MEELILSLLGDGKEISFFVLFVAMLIYTMRTNDTREEKYRETIESLTETLKDVADIKDTVHEINEKINS